MNRDRHPEREHVAAAHPPPREVALPLQPKIILEFLGAAAGIAAFVGLVGGAMLWIKLDELGLPADRAVSELPNTMLMTAGVQALAVPALAGLVAVIALYALDDWDKALMIVAFVIAFVAGVLLEAELVDLEVGWGLILPLVAAAAVASLVAWSAHKISGLIVANGDRPILVTAAVLGAAMLGLVFVAFRLPVIPHMLVLALAIIVAATAIFSTARTRPGHRPLGWVVFVSFLLVGAAIAIARTADEPKLEPVALLLKEPDEQIAGFYVGEADGRVQIAELRNIGSVVEVSAEPVDAIVSVARDRVVRMSLREPAGLGPSDAGRGRAQTLLEDLVLQQRLLRGQDAPEAKPIATSDPVHTFAPLVSIHSEEPIAPKPVEYFLKESRLLWSFRGCPPKVVSEGLTTKAQLDALEQGRFRQKAHCGDKGTAYASSEYTRPYGKDRRGLVGREGFYLDIPRDLRQPDVKSTKQGTQKVLTSTPVYYERNEERTTQANDERITYWFFYPFSIPPGGNEMVGHEGDWERVSVLVTKEKEGWKPLSVRYHEHDTHVDINWADVRKAPDETGLLTHPRAYVAKESHATFRRAGQFAQVLARGGAEIIKVTDEARACPDCPLWFTWQKLVNAKVQPWYHFGGAWGQVGDVSDFTGPLGPSEYKRDGKSNAPETSIQQIGDVTPPEPAL